MKFFVLTGINNLLKILDIVSTWLGMHGNKQMEQMSLISLGIPHPVKNL